MNMKKLKIDRMREEALVLAAFLDIAQQGTDALARYLLHVGISAGDINEAGAVCGAVLRHYRLKSEAYDIDAVANDLARWPPIARRIEEAMRAKRKVSD